MQKNLSIINKDPGKFLSAICILEVQVFYIYSFPLSDFERKIFPTWSAFQNNSLLGRILTSVALKVQVCAYHQ